MAEINYGNPCNNCPDGYTWDPQLEECVLVETVPALYSGTLLSVDKAVVNAGYSIGGVRLYAPIGASQIPITRIGTNNTTFTLVDNLLNPIPIHSTVRNSLWGTMTPGCDPTGSPTFGGRLNTVGVWAPGIPDGQELCFEFCVTIEEGENTQKCIGIAGDNSVKFSINGVLFVDITAANNAQTRPFNYWHVFPIDLPPGQHIITLCGTNISSDASFGAEIYDITYNGFITTLLDPDNATVPTCGNVPGDIEPYLLFSTLDMVGKNVPDPNNPGEWSCPDDPTDPYELNSCDGTPDCVRTLTAVPEECCYRVKDCESEDEFIIKINAECTSQIQVLTVGSVWTFELTDLACELPPLIDGKCYEVIGFENPCSETENICYYCPVQERLTCDDCNPCYKCTNCNDETEIIYFKWGAPPTAPLNTDLIHTFEYAPEKCWSCEEIQSGCVPPGVVEQYTYEVCSNLPFEIDTILSDLVLNTGTYTYEFYIDSAHTTSWTGNTVSWMPPYPVDYEGPIETLYVLIYQEGCNTPAEVVLNLVWTNPLECAENCTNPRVGDSIAQICVCQGNTIDLTQYNTLLASPTHPYFSLFVYEWYTDQTLSSLVPDPTNVTVYAVPITYYLKVSYEACQNLWFSDGSLQVVQIPDTNENCLEVCI
jgi:hypothetical protein